MLKTTEAHQPAQPNPRKRILVVEDDAVNLEYFIRILKKAGYEPFPEARAVAALKTLTSEAIDLILTDIAMPFMSGIDMLKRIRQIPRFADLPVIVCSAMKTREYVVMAAQLRVHSFVVKPVDRQYLLERIALAFQDQEACASTLR